MQNDFINSQRNKQLFLSYNEHGEFFRSDTPITSLEHPDDKKPNKNRTREQHKDKKPQFFNLMLDFQQSVFHEDSYNLTEVEAGMILMLCTYVRYTDHTLDRNYIRVGGKNASNKELAEVLKITVGQFRDNYKKKLIAKGVLHQDKYGMYLDDKVMTRGLLRENKAYQVLLEPVREIYDMFVTDKKPKSIKHVGLFFALIPFIQKKNNLLVLSEYDDEYDTYAPHSYDSIAQALGKRNEKIKGKPYGTFQRDIMQMNDTYYKKYHHHLIFETTLIITPVSDIDKRKIKTLGLVINPNVTFSSTDDNRFKLEQLLFGDRKDSNEPTDTVEEIQTALIETALKPKKRSRYGHVLAFLMKDGTLNYCEVSKDYTQLVDDKPLIAHITNELDNHEYLKFQNAQLQCNEVISVQAFKLFQLKAVLDYEMKSHELIPCTYDNNFHGLTFM